MHVFERGLPQLTRSTSSNETLTEKTHEYYIPLHLAFIDFHAAFESTETCSFPGDISKARIDTRYFNLITNIYQNASLQIHIDRDLIIDKITDNREVRQGDTFAPSYSIWPQIFLKNVDGQNKGIKIEGQYLNHLGFRRRSRPHQHRHK